MAMRRGCRRREMELVGQRTGRKMEGKGETVMNLTLRSIHGGAFSWSSL